MRRRSRTRPAPKIPKIAPEAPRVGTFGVRRSAPAEPTGIVVDVLRATSTIAQAIAAGYERVLCCAEVEDARRLRTAGVVLAGERDCVRIPGFDLGNSPADFAEPRGR